MRAARSRSRSGILAHQRLELAHELASAADREVRLEAELDRPQAELFEADDLGLREGFVRHVRERRPAPELERLAKQLRRHIGCRVFGVVHEPLEPQQIKLGRSHADDVAGRLGDDHLAPPE
jgi:hypothetical protein